MSLLQGVLRSHTTTDTLDKRLSNASISQRTQLNPDKDDSDDELVNVVCPLISPLSMTYVHPYRYQYLVPLLALCLHRGPSHPHAERLVDLHQDPSILADRASHPAILLKSSRQIYHR